MIANVQPHQNQTADRRGERRLRFCWDAQVYGTNHDRGTLARMIDLNSQGAAMLLDSSSHVSPGDCIELGLTYPRVEGQAFQIIHDHRTGTVIRTQPYNQSLSRVVVHFGQPIVDPPGTHNDYISN